MQLRLATRATSAVYVAEKQWQLATLSQCPWHRDSRCGFCRHGTYERVRPRGTFIARWYCPKARRTVSALPDCLASHYSGTLADLEALVLAYERAPSRAEATEHCRTDIELPGALRYLDRLSAAVHQALAAIVGLCPERFVGLAPTVHAFAKTLGGEPVLTSLREGLARYLGELPTPFGFNPHRNIPGAPGRGRQHKVGAAPLEALIQPRPRARAPVRAPPE